MERFRKMLTLCLTACGAALLAGAVAGQTPGKATHPGTDGRWNEDGIW